MPHLLIEVACSNTTTEEITSKTNHVSFSQPVSFNLQLRQTSCHLYPPFQRKLHHLFTHPTSLRCCTKLLSLAIPPISLPESHPFGHPWKAHGFFLLPSFKYRHSLSGWAAENSVWPKNWEGRLVNGLLWWNRPPSRKLVPGKKWEKCLEHATESFLNNHSGTSSSAWASGYLLNSGRNKPDGGVVAGGGLDLLAASCRAGESRPSIWNKSAEWSQFSFHHFHIQ